MNVRFSDEVNPSQAAKVIDVLRAPRLYIPTEADYGSHHEPWLAKTEYELTSGTRHALLIEDEIGSAGVGIFRIDSDNPDVVDFRNISIDPRVGGRRFGSFLVRNVEHIASFTYPEATTLRVDTKHTNSDMIAFLERQGYVRQSMSDLYSSGKLDIILQKPITR